MICEKCGNSIEAIDTFCKACGKKISSPQNIASSPHMLHTARIGHYAITIERR